MSEANDSDETGAVTELRVRAIYERTFGLEHRGWKDVSRFATWTGVLFSVLVAESVISDPVHAAVGPAVIVLGAVAGVTWNQHKRRPRGTTVTR
jgi:hypothetical protein